MKKKMLFLVAIIVIAFAALVGCENVDTLSVRLDKDVYIVEYGDVVNYSVLNVPDVADATVTVSDDSILEMVDGKLTAVKVGAATITVKIAEKAMSATVVVLQKALKTPEVTITDNVASWEPVENADKYLIIVGTSVTVQTQTSFDLNGLDTDKYDFCVSASSSDPNFAESTFSATKFDLGRFELSFNTNGGNIVRTMHIKPSTAVNAEVPAKDGHTFIGWYTDNNFNNEFDNVMPEKNLTLYARWINGEATVINEGESIQAAIDNGARRIFVKAGVFAEYLNLNREITLLGNNYDIKPGAAKRPETILCPAANEDFNDVNGKAIIKISAPKITVSGFTVDGDNPELTNIWTEEKNNAMQALITGSTLSRVEARALYNSLVNKDVGIDAALGIKVVRLSTADPSLTNIVIENNNIKNFTFCAISLNNYNTKLALSNEGSRIANNELSGVLSFGLLNAGAYAGSYGEAMIIDGFTAEIDGNLIHDNAYGIQFSNVYFTGSEASFTNNKFINNSVGIWLNSTGFSNKTIIKNNEFIQNEDYKNVVGMQSFSSIGLLLSSTENGKLNISENTFSGLEAGILFASVRVNTVMVEKNTFSSCDNAIALRPAFIVFTITAITDVTLRDDNIFVDNGKNIELQTPTKNYFKITIIDADGIVVETLTKNPA